MIESAANMGRGYEFFGNRELARISFERAHQYAKAQVEFLRAVLTCLAAIGANSPTDCSLLRGVFGGEVPTLAPGWDSFDTSTEDTKAEDMAATGFLMGRTTETQTDWERRAQSSTEETAIPDLCVGVGEEIRVRVIRSEVPGEFVVVTRKGLEKIGEYFTDDKADANATAKAIAKAYAERGFAVRVFAK